MGASLHKSAQKACAPVDSHPYRQARICTLKSSYNPGFQSPYSLRSSSRMSGEGHVSQDVSSSFVFETVSAWKPPEMSP